MLSRATGGGLIEPRVEGLIKATGIDFRIGGNRAFSVPWLRRHPGASLAQTGGNH